MVIMRVLYQKVVQIINQVNFNAIWKGFSKFDFALYDNTFIYLESEIIPYDNRFLGNTSIEYNHNFIAIWKIDNPKIEDPELLAANIIHEMFHAFQKSKGENRFPNDLDLLNYPDDFVNHKLRYMEHLFLVKEFEADNLVDTKHNILKFISVRKHRHQLLGDMILQEYYTETIEGMAEYAGSSALKQISEEKYANRMNEYIANLLRLDDQFFDIRRMSYFLGTIFITTLSMLDIDFHHEIGQTKTSFYDMVSDSISSGQSIGIPLEKD